MGEAIRVRAIVLAKTDYKENDRILTIFSPSHGRLTVTARGVKKQNAKLRAGSEVFAFGTFLLDKTRGRYTVTGFDSVDPFTELRENFDRLSAGALLLRMTERSIEEDEPSPQLFSLLLRCLDKLRDEKIPCGMVLSVFMIKFCILAGYQPELDRCALCGKQEDLVCLSPAAGGTVCLPCAPDAHKSISKACLFYLRALVQKNFDELWNIRPSAQQLQELYRVCCFYTAWFFDEKIGLMEYMNKYHLI